MEGAGTLRLSDSQRQPDFLRQTIGQPRYAASMSDYLVILRLGKRYPYCIERLGADGSRVVVEGWSTEALAAHRLQDIMDEEIASARRTAALLPTVDDPCLPGHRS